MDGSPCPPRAPQSVVLGSVVTVVGRGGCDASAGDPSMLPYFNTSGPCIPGEHYMLPPERRLGHVLALIEGQRSSRAP